MTASTEAGRSAIPERDKRFWDRIARSYAKSTIGDLEGYERTLARTETLLSLDRTVLELGCGTGTTALRLAPASGDYLATDLSPGMIAIAREKLQGAGIDGLAFEAATAETVSARAGGFDVVLGFNYLHLVPDLSATLERIHALVAPGGVFISKTPCLAEMNRLILLAIPLMRLIGRAPASILRFGEGELLAAMKAAGFEIEANERHGSGRKDVRPYIVARRSS